MYFTSPRPKLTDPQRTGRAPASSPQSFAALRQPGYRAYFVGSALAMMADSIEHVISYWIIFQKFHSPALGGFAMLSHWAAVFCSSRCGPERSPTASIRGA